MCNNCIVNAVTGEERPDISNAPQVPITDEFIESYMILLHSEVLSEKVLSTELYNATGAYLNNALDAGYKLNFQYGGDADKLYKELRHNLWHFSAAKQYQQNREILSNFIAPLETIPYTEFKKTAEGIMANYNDRFLRTEYTTSVANSQSARDWNNLETDDTIQMIKYRTQQDTKVRPGHASINGTTLPKSDPFWATHYPPNGWHCRCFTLDLGEYAKENKPEQIPVHGIDPDFPKMFQMNPGKDKLIFPNSHPYFRVSQGDRIFKEANYGLPITDTE